MSFCLTAPSYYLNQCWLIGFCGIQLGPILQWMAGLLFCMKSLKIIVLKLLPHLLGDNISPRKLAIWMNCFIYILLHLFTCNLLWPSFDKKSMSIQKWKQANVHTLLWFVCYEHFCKIEHTCSYISCIYGLCFMCGHVQTLSGISFQRIKQVLFLYKGSQV